MDLVVFRTISSALRTVARDRVVSVQRRQYRAGDEVGEETVVILDGDEKVYTHELPSQIALRLEVAEPVVVQYERAYAGLLRDYTTLQGDLRVAESRLDSAQAETQLLQEQLAAQRAQQAQHGLSAAEGAAHALAIVASEGEREVEVAVDPGPLRWRSQARQPLRVVGVTALVTVGVVTWLLTYGVGCL